VLSIREGNPLEFLLSPRRNGEAAKRFFAKALAAPHSSTPGVITVDKNAADPKAWKRAESAKNHASFLYIAAEQVPQQPHRARSPLHKTIGQARDGVLFLRNGVANRCRGYEAMNMWRSVQIQGVEKGDSMKQVAFIASLFGVAV
jgi:transposase, IS6 family